MLAQLRQIAGPDAPIMLGFDRGGAYAPVFTACREAHVDWVTYRRAPLAPTTTAAPGHTTSTPTASRSASCWPTNRSTSTATAPPGS